MSEIQYTYYRQFGNSIHLRYKNKGDNKTHSTVIKDYEPTLYLTTNKHTKVKTIYGENLETRKLKSIKEAKEFIDTYSNVGNVTIHGNSNFASQYIIEQYGGKRVDYDNSIIRSVYIDIEVYMGDEEGFPYPVEAKGKINLITLYDSIDKVYYTFGLPPDEHSSYDVENRHDDLKDETIEYYEFSSEEELLTAFLNFMQLKSYDVITGWNSQGFDLPYIYFRCCKIVGEKFTTCSLSPFNRIDIREKENSYKKKETTVFIHGLPHLDYLIMYKKHMHEPRENYKLDFIANAEIGTNKLTYEESGNLDNLYVENYQKMTDYNIKDTKLVVDINKKIQLIDMSFALMYYTLANLEDTIATVRIWETCIAKYLYSIGKIPLFKAPETEYRSFEGAYVKEPIPGKYNYVVSFDLNSLYPLTVKQYNIGPETIVKDNDLHPELLAIREKHTFDDLLNKRIDLSVLEKHNVTMAANFQFYRKDIKSFIGAVMYEVYTDRRVFKDIMLDAEQHMEQAKNDTEYHEWDSVRVINSVLQMAMKIFINSGYGAIGNQYFLYYQVENAEAITKSGQLINKWTFNHTNKLLNEIANTKGIDYCIAGDTDSNYYWLENIVTKLFKPDDDIHYKVDRIDDFCKEILTPEIAKYTQELSDYVNSYENMMVWAREVIAPTAIWVAKKNYAMNVLDSEGVRFNNIKFKMKGLEAVKSNTPAWARAFLKECYQLCLESDETTVQGRISEIYKEMLTYDYNDISIPSGVNGIGHYYDPVTTYKKGTPKHVKATILYNLMLEKKNMKNIEPVKDGAKIKMLPLTMPNPVGGEVIAFETFLPKEFGVEDYIDYDKIYEHAFSRPMQRFLTAIGWTLEEVISIDSFF